MMWNGIKKEKIVVDKVSGAVVWCWCMGKSVVGFSNLKKS